MSIIKLWVLNKIFKKFKVEVVEMLGSKVNGMFMWVCFMIVELFKKLREFVICEVLNKVFWGLIEMFRYVLIGFLVFIKDE